MMNERVSELTTYLKALSAAQSSGYKCNGEIAEVIRELRIETAVSNPDDKAGVYQRKLLEMCGEYYSKDKRFVNAQIYYAYLTGMSGDIYLPRASGATTSVKALMKTFDDVVYLEFGAHTESSNIFDKVVFTDGEKYLPKGSRPHCVIRIRPFEVSDVERDHLKARIY